MYNLFKVFYVTLLIITIVQSNDDEEPNIEEGTKISRHQHHKTKLPSKETDVPKFVNDNSDPEDLESETERNDHEDEDVTNIESSARPKNPKPESNENADIEQNSEEQVPRTLFVGNLNTRLATSSQQDNRNNLSEDDSNNKSNNDISDTDESDEILVHTPNKKTLSPNVILDLKARSGYVGSEENLKASSGTSDENVSMIGHFPHHHRSNMNIRSGFIPQDYMDDINLNRNVEETATSPYNNLLRKIMIPRLYQPSAKPEMMPSYVSNSHPTYGNPLFNDNNGNALAYPNSISHEIKWEPSKVLGPNNNTQTHYFVNASPNQLIEQRTNDRCSTCQFPSLGTFPEDNIRRSVDEKGKHTGSAEHLDRKFVTADGRSLEFEPTGNNEYPLVYDVTKESEEIKRMQGAIPHDVFRNHALITTDYQQHERNSQQNLHSKEVSPFSKILNPFYHPTNPILLSRRRFDVGGIRRFTG